MIATKNSQEMERRSLFIASPEIWIVIKITGWVEDQASKSMGIVLRRGEPDKKQECWFNHARHPLSHPSHKNNDVARVGHSKVHPLWVGEDGGGF
jgi:hypothetical protein